MSRFTLLRSYCAIKAPVRLATPGALGGHLLLPCFPLPLDDLRGMADRGPQYSAWSS
jgi:hypothetical protein